MRVSVAWNARHRAAGALVVLALLGAGCSEEAVLPGCQGEVVAAFKRLKTSGRPYRKVTVMAVNGQGDFRQTFEFIPPDRRRQVTDNGVPGYGPVETIQVGARTWFRQSHANGGWSDWERSEIALTAGPVRKDVAGDEEVFACLGEVEFSGKIYIGYSARVRTVFFSIVPRRPSGQEEQERLAELRQMPQEWRTVFLDVSSLLPAHDLIAQENRLAQLAQNR